MRLAVLPLVASLAIGCGSGEPPDGARDAGPDDDAAVDGGEDAAPPVPTPPAEPAPPAWPRFTPCPAGWREVPDPADPQLVICDPWPEGGPLDCPADAAHFPGEPGCSRVGPPCPAGDFAEDLPEGASVVYVRPGADPDADGSRERPFATIAGALAAAPAEAIVALSKGVFDERVETGSPVTLWGACVAETLIAPADADDQVTLRLSGSFRGLRNLTVTGPGPGVTLAEGIEAVTLDSVVVRDTEAPGVRVGEEVHLEASNVVVRDVTPDASETSGLRVGQRAQVLLARAAFERAGAAGVFVDELAYFAATDLSVREGRRHPHEEALAMGLRVWGVAVLARAAFRGNADAAIGVFHPSALLEADDLVVEDSAPRADGNLGLGLFAGDGASVTLRRARFERSTQAAISTNPAYATLEDVLIRDTRARTAEVAIGNGIEIWGGTTRMERVAVLGSHHAGVLQLDDGLSAAIDLIVRDTHAVRLEGSARGSGILLHDGGRMDVLRAEVARSDVSGILLTGPYSALAAWDLTVLGGGGPLDGAHGGGLFAGDGAQVDLRRARIEGTRTAAIDLRDAETALFGTDVTLRDTAADAAGRYGAGALVLDAARLELDRVLVERSRLAGILGQGAGTWVVLANLSVVDTLAQECAPATCPAEDGGYGLAALEGSSGSVSRFDVSNAAACGVLVATGATVDLHEGRVGAGSVGACVPDSDFDVSSLQDCVRYDDEVALDRAETWVPDGRGASRPQ